MRYDGPWSDFVAQINVDWQFGYRCHLMRLDQLGRQERFGDDVSRSYIDGYTAALSAQDRRLLAVMCEGEIRAAMLFCTEAQFRGQTVPIAATVVQAAFSVEPDYRQSGALDALIATALPLCRALQKTHLVISDVGVATELRSLATRYGARLAFVGDECQAWFELCPTHRGEPLAVPPGAAPDEGYEPAAPAGS